MNVNKRSLGMLTAVLFLLCVPVCAALPQLSAQPRNSPAYTEILPMPYPPPVP